MKPAYTSISVSEDQLNYQDNALWLRIENYAIDDAKAVIPFSKKIAQTENWTEDFSCHAIQEYKRFIYLCCISKNGASPSIVVDKVWHMHLLYTMEYWKNFCPNILQRELHHFPNVGGIIDYNKHQDWYLETLILYIRVFKQNPPAKFWRIPPQLKPFLYPEPEPASKTSLAFSISTIPAPFYYLALILPFLFSWLWFGELPIPDLSIPQYFLIFFPLTLIANWVIVRNEDSHLQPNIDHLAQYNRYQLAYFTGGYKNSFLLLVNDLEEHKWIKIKDTEEKYEEKFFSLSILKSSTVENHNFIQSQSLFQSLEKLPDPSNFSLKQLDAALSDYLPPISIVETPAAKEDPFIFPVWGVMVLLIIWCLPSEEPNTFSIILYVVFFLMNCVLMSAWLTPQDDHYQMTRAIKKRARFLKEIITENQETIITSQFTIISGSSFFGKLSNFFENNQSCGSSVPSSCGCGC